jgi:ATP-grasp domain
VEAARRKLIRDLQDRLGARKLVWVGTRGYDSSCLMDLPQFSESYAIIAPLGSVSLAVDFALEEVSGQRVDLDTYKIDDDRSEPAQELRRRLLDSLNEPAAVLAYRPSALLSALCYPRSDFVTYLGMFHERQATFEHKPWVENELRRRGLPIIPWRYFAKEDRQRLEEEVTSLGALVVRANRSDGGAGVKAISSPDEIAAHISDSRDGFVAATPLLEPHVPLNVNACVFQDGTISLHPASMQLIGIEACTRRRFGYCGNDFAAIKDLDSELLQQFDSITRRAGRWLWSQGYLGAFGVDALVHQGRLLLAEINPRFQGSSLLSARIDRAMGRPDLFLCHLAAHLGLAAPPDRRLSEIVQEQGSFAQVVYHNLQTEAALAEVPDLVGDLALELIPSADVRVHPNATVWRVLVPGAVTRNGRTIDLAVCMPPHEVFTTNVAACGHAVGKG